MTSATSSQWTSTLTAMGLFVVTAVASQWLQNIHHLQTKRRGERKKEGKNRNYNDNDSTSTFDETREMVARRRAFRRRQLSRRLSFHQTDNETTNHASEESDGPIQDFWTSSISSGEESSPDLFPHRPQQYRAFRRRSRRHRSFEKSVEGGNQSSNQILGSLVSDQYHDFHPKYQNWRHFEHCNEGDRSKQRKQQKQQQQQQAGEQAGEGEEAATPIQASFPKRSMRSRRKQRRRKQRSSSPNDSCSTDQASLSTFDDECDSDNQFVWTGGHASKYHRQCSSKSDCLLRSGNDDSESEASAKLTETETKHVIKTDVDDHTEGLSRFERFVRMLTNSVIDDDSPGQTTNIRVSRLSSTSSSNSNSENYETALDIDNDNQEGDSSSSSENLIEDHHRALRTEYNAQIMPEKLVLVRHGQSLGNVDETVYATTPDNAMPITDLGWEQARAAGSILKTKILKPNESVHFMVSPYARTVETFHGIVSAWCDPESPEFAAIRDPNRKVNAWYERLTELGLTWNEDPRIREQDFGNYQNPEVTRKAKEERHRFGAFYYRFNNGESGSDVFDRVSTFLDSLWRSFETNSAENYVLVTHGIVLRVLMARYFRYTITQLNMLANPKNCEMVVLGHAGDGRLDLEGRCALEILKDRDGKQHVSGYKFHKRMRILPKSHIRTVRFRISSKDRPRTRSLHVERKTRREKPDAEANHHLRTKGEADANPTL